MRRLFLRVAMLLLCASPLATWGCAARAGDPGASTVVRDARAERYRLPGGHGVVTLLVNPQSAPGTHAAMSLLELEPGGVVPEHAHDESDEIVYTLEGFGVVTLDGINHELGPGSAVHVPAGVPHAFRVLGDSIWKGVQVYSPPGPEARFRSGEAVTPEPDEIPAQPRASRM